MTWRLSGATVRRFGVLLSGTAVAQAIPMLLSPVLTRLYTPADYGNLALLTAVVSLLSAVATGRYHMAILIPRTEQEAFNLVRLSLIINLATCAAAATGFAVALWALPSLGWLNGLGVWVLAAPVSAFFGSISAIGTSYNLRMDTPKTIAFAGVSQATLAGGGQIAMAQPVGGKTGLILGNLLGALVGASLFARSLRNGAPTRSHGSMTLWQSALRYRSFPLIDTWGTLANLGSTSLLIFGLAFLFSEEQLGQYSLAYRFMALPMILIGTILAQLIAREIALKLGTAHLAGYYNKMAFALFAIATPTFAAIWLVAEPAFALIFGEPWRMAGEIAGAMTPLVWIRFIAGPLSTVFTIAERQKEFLFSQIGLLLVTVGALTVAWSRELSVVEAIWIHSLVSATIYAGLLLRGAIVARAESYVNGISPASIDSPNR